MIAFLTSFLLTALLTPGVIQLARRLGWISYPREDRWHSRPTALMGGIAIYLGTVAAWLTVGDRASVLLLLAPVTGLFLLGAVDDRLVELRPHHKLIGQVAAGAALTAGGVQFQGVPPLLALPLTLFWLVGITNAVNLLDNMDGLAAGVSCISALVLAAYSLIGGDAATATAALALAGGCAGFLLFNFKPARVFMGDCGSMFIGLSLAALALQASRRSSPDLALSLLVPAAALAVPIFDTTLVAVARAVHGRPIFPGFRDHSSHRMVALGLSERATVLVLYALTALFGCLALLAVPLPLPVVLVISALLFLGLLVLGLYLGFLQVYPVESRAPLHVRLLRGRLRHHKRILQVLLDVLLIQVAFVGASALRFEGSLSPSVTQAVLRALPLVLVAKLASLVLCRAYRAVWRFAGIADAVAAAAGSTLGSLSAIALLMAAGVGWGLSGAAWIIDWMLFTALVVASRMGYVILRELFGMLPPRDAPCAVIVGAGAEALALVQKLRDPLAPQRAHLLGILDDDPSTQGRMLNLVPVVGAVSSLPALIRAQGITYCLLGVAPRSEEGRKILAFCRREGISLSLDLDLFSPPADGEPVIAAAA
jgi:UDP-GlcNAc:undecaprenyl-phosphate GlcNAc-1-phosphate transferase